MARTIVYAGLLVLAMLCVAALVGGTPDDVFSALVPHDTGRVTSALRSGVRVHLSDGRRPTLVLFGYAACGDACPRTLSVLASPTLAGDLDPLPRVIFVDVDTWHDSASRVAAYVRHFPRVEGFALSQADTQALEAATGARGTSQPSDVPAHDARVFIIDPSGLLVAPLQPGVDHQTLVRTLHRLFPPSARGIQVGLPGTP